MIAALRTARPPAPDPEPDATPLGLRQLAPALALGPLVVALLVLL